MILTLKLKIYVGKMKRQLIRQSPGNTRFVRNKLIDLEKEEYANSGRFIRFAGMCRKITEMKKKYDFLKITSVRCLRQMARKLEFSLKAFLKNKEQGYGFPGYRRKSRYEGILIYPRDFKFNGCFLYLPKIGWVKLRDKKLKTAEWGKIVNNVKQVWVKEDASGFFAYIIYEGETKKLKKNGKAIGIDVGIKSTLALSNGQILSLDKKKIMKLVEKIERLQSIIDKKREINKKRKIYRSNRLLRLEIKRDKLFLKIGNIKPDFYHKSTDYILKSHGYVAVEDLNLKKLKETQTNGKKASKRIHKYLQYISLSEFFGILEYKAKKYGRTLIKVDPKNTSKTCSNCGCILTQMKLNERTFNCPNCNLKLDRDINAAVNILNRGIRLLPVPSGHGGYRREMPFARTAIR